MKFDPYYLKVAGTIFAMCAVISFGYTVHVPPMTLTIFGFALGAYYGQIATRRYFARSIRHIEVSIEGAIRIYKHEGIKYARLSELPHDMRVKLLRHIKAEGIAQPAVPDVTECDTVLFDDLRAWIDSQGVQHGD